MDMATHLQAIYNTLDEIEVRGHENVKRMSLCMETRTMLLRAKAKKRWPINWVSTAMAMSPGEIWIDMPFDGRLPEAARAFDGCETLTVYADENDQTGTVYAGYTKLTHMMLDTSLTLRLRKEEAHAADHA